VYWHPTRELIVSAHVDDLLIAGADSERRKLLDELARHLKIKELGVMGSTWTRYLGRQFKITKQGFDIRCDIKHIDDLVEMTGVGGLTNLNTPAVPGTQPTESKKLS
jgi:hypothetical protein